MNKFYVCIVSLAGVLLIGCEDEPEPVPAPPSSLLASVVSTTQIDLSWSDNSSNETGFKIERKEGLGEFVIVGTAGKDVNAYSDQGLVERTVYTYRVFAVSASHETGEYSNEASATTQGTPVLSTSGISAITAFDAISGGTITNDGGSAITAKGVVWSTGPNPTVSLATKTVDGTGGGEFISTIVELNWSTTYHVRAYATNSTGTGYGNDLTFTTGQLSITTTTPSAIGYFSANTGGSVGTDGGYPISERGVVWSETQNPTTALTTKIIQGTGTGDFSSSLINLISNVRYYVRSYAVSSAGTAYGQEVEFTTNGLSDIDGNTYSVVQIGTQLWMSENLETASYKDGTGIDLVTDNTAWSTSITGAYSWWNNNKAINTGINGALYNWYAVNTGKLCPTDWHVPAETDWNTLSNYLGGNAVAGGKMKATGTQFWSSPNVGATNESGFNGLPIGVRTTNGNFSGIGTNIDMWSATEKDASTAYPRDLQFDTGALLLEPNGTPKAFGFAVRCVKD